MTERVSKFITTQAVHHGPGALNQLSREVRKRSCQRVGIITDPSIAQVGILQRVRDILETDTFCFAEVIPEPPYELVDQCVSFLRGHQCDLVIGLGGGSSIDTAKMAAVMLNNTEKISEYFGVDKIPNPGIPVIAIPTTAGTGSEVSPASVFTDSRDDTKKGVRTDFLLPAAAILDPEFTLSLPQKLTASTGIDALTHAIECYTAFNATLLSDLAAEKGMSLIGTHLRKAYADGRDMDARYGMLMGSYLAGIALAVANVGVVHALAQTIGGLYHIPHGIANALFLPYVMEFNRIACREKYARVAALMGESIDGLSLDDASLKAVKAVRRLTQDLKIPQRLRDLEIPEDTIELVPGRCLQTQGRIVVNNPRTLTLEEAREIVQAAY
ncbi:MAG: iron-containing alcohol dehydrogenase [Deltaproteobacteria bacterium]|nr:iron-containing alcohol dehydrogenase [Deltaproteobacteria bacterium]